METLQNILLSVFLLIAQVGASDPKLVPQKLKLEVPGKVTNVMWSASQNDGSAAALQISLPHYLAGTPQPAQPKIDVWLLKDDGATIRPLGRPTLINTRGAGSAQPTLIYLYQGEDVAKAVGVVLSIDGQFFVEKLPKR